MKALCKRRHQSRQKSKASINFQINTTMQIKIFTLPISSSERSEDELNKFLRSHRVLKTEHHFCPDDGGYWTFLVEYLEGDPIAEVPPANRKERKDYSKELNDEEIERFEYFKKVRRELATKFSLPAYLIFTNEELAILAHVPELNEESARLVKGVAPSRMKDYVKYFYVVSDGEAGGQLDAEDSGNGEPA